MKRIFNCFIFCLPWISFGQIEDSLAVDHKYLEDQFYIGISYNFLLNKPIDVTQRNLSYGLFGGIIKDLPLNEQRTKGLGIGIGYGVNSYYSNLLVTEAQNSFLYSVADVETDLRRSKIETHLIELPIELRWRNSTASEYKFWRLYAGAKFAYVIGGRSKFVSDSQKLSFYNTDIRKFQYGLTLNFGYNTFNIHAYYSLIGLFNDSVSIGAENIHMKPLRIGLIFYIL